ncbi:unnamed protein product [Schistosoma curassoni]|uniref:Reverse transcriptase domain-containing protein n=1 Tax=Schistosoma curassoni TaxID=6186 RepID=A0A183L579_9TREM|nr:unnamed protein product [Schistosoma curassoni]
MKISTPEEKRGIQWTSRMQLDDLDFADDLALLSQSQKQMHEKTTSIAAASAAVGLKIHKGRSKILRHNTACTNPVTIDGEDLEDVKTAAYLGSIIGEQDGSDADVKVWSKSSIFTTEEHLKLKTIVNQHKSQDFQYKCQDSSTVWGGNLENYESHHPDDTSVY